MYNHANELLRAILNYCSFNTYKADSVSKLDVSREKQAQQTSKNNNNNKERKENQNIVCFNCRKPGHISRNCTEPQKRKKCTKCNKYGHNEENCEATQKSKCNTIEENKEKFNMKMVKINNVVVEALIDSGSARSLIKRNFANQFENNFKEKCFVRLKGFAGSEYECVELMKSNIIIDDVCVNANLLIIDDNKLDYDVLVGRDVLCTNGNVFVIDGEDCWMKSKVNIINNATVENENLKKVLLKYEGRFNTLGKAKLLKMNIKLDSDIPINMKPYRLPFGKRPILDEIIQDLLAKDVKVCLHI